MTKFLMSNYFLGILALDIKILLEIIIYDLEI